MKQVMQILVLAGLTACASQEAEQARQEEDQAVRDFIAVRGLEELDKIRTGDSQGWDKIADKFLVYNTRRASYLFEFWRRCRELDDNTEITPDVRRERNTIYARYETLRGCQIHKIYALTEADAIELRDLGEAPGSRN